MTKSKPLSKLIAYVVTIAILVGSVSPAYAQIDITIDGSGSSGGNTWRDGYASPSELYTTRPGGSQEYTDWVQNPWNDTVTRPVAN